MEEAVVRHYQELKKLEDQKLVERADFNWRVQAEKELIETERRQRANQTAQLM